MRIYCLKWICLASPLSFDFFSQLLKTLIFTFLFVVTAAGVVSCSGPKIAPYIIHSADYIFLWCFEISENNLRNQKTL